MKNPNGYGSISKLSGKRRKPYMVRVTVGYTEDRKQIMKVLGCYETKAQALNTLAAYNNNPYDLDTKSITFKEMLDRLMESKKGIIDKSTERMYISTCSCLKPLYDYKMGELRTVHLQRLIDSLGLSSGRLKSIKSFIGMAYKKSMELDVVNKDYSQFIKLPKHKKVIERKIFTEDEIALLWANVNEVNYIDVILILIYTGMRINELLKLKKKNVDLVNNVITGGSKTEAGKNRVIPIHPKIQPLIIKRMDNLTDYLIPNVTETSYYIYNNFRQQVFLTIMDKLGMEHTIHDTRHTFATMISNVSNDETAITGIIGHTNIEMTKKYTHTNIDKMREEIEKIN